MQKLTNEFKIEFTKGDTYALAIKFKNITEDLRLAYFSVKDNPDDAPLIQKSLGAGIDKIDDRDYKNEKTYKFQLQPADTVNLEAQTQYLYDIQVTIGNVVKTVLHGVFVLRNTISGTTSVTASNLEIEVDDEVETELLATTPATNGVEYEQDPVACAKIGDLTLLATTVKDSLVQAINEVRATTVLNFTDLWNIKNGSLKVPEAKNVSEKIGSKSLSAIFESDGKTVKNASTANDITKTIVWEGCSRLSKDLLLSNAILESGYRYTVTVGAEDKTIACFLMGIACPSAITDGNVTLVVDYLAYDDGGYILYIECDAENKVTGITGFKGLDAFYIHSITRLEKIV